jgi:hypothetical protein
MIFYCFNKENLAVILYMGPFGVNLLSMISILLTFWDKVFILMLFKRGIKLFLSLIDFTLPIVI